MNPRWRWLWRGDLPADAIAVEYRADPFTRGPRLADAIATDWAARLSAPGAPVLSDDPVAPLLGHAASPTRLHLRLGRSSYAHWLYAAGRQPELEQEFGPAGPCRPLALCAALITSDGSLLMQQRSDRVAEGPGLLHVPGGHLDPTLHLRAGLPHPTVAMLTELQEELSVLPGDLADGRLLGLIENRENGKPELLYRWRLLLAEGELRERARTADDRFEAVSLSLLPAAQWRRQAAAADLALPSAALLSILEP